MRSIKGRVCIVLIFFFLTLPVFRAQGQVRPEEADPVSLVGMTLDELIRVFGAPRSVHPVRGLEEWQDDVVFVYDRGDFYVYKDRVWQLGLKEARGIKSGDSRAVVSLVLGPGAEARGNSLFCPIHEGAWPLMLRCDFDAGGSALGIFIYRTDF